MPRSTPLPPRPRIVQSAVWLYVVIAAANVGVGIWSLSFVPEIVRTLAAQGKAVPQQAIVLTVATIAIATLLFSGAMVFFTVRFRRGSTWARPALLTLSLLSIAALLTGGGPGLIVIGLCIAAAIVVTRAPVTAWLRAAQGLPRG